MARRNSVRFTTVSSVIPPELEESDDNSGMGPSSRPQMTRRSSTRFGSAIPQVQSESTHSGDSDANIHAVDDGPPSRRFRPQISRHNSTRFPAVDPTQSDENDSDPSSPEGTTRLGTALVEERLLSAREAVAAQEAAEAAAQAEAAAAAAAEQEAEEGAMPMPGNMETQEPLRMSLMDLLEETDRQMGFEGSRYTMGDIEACDDDDDDEEEEEEEEEEDRGDGGAAIEYTLLRVHGCVQESSGFKGVIALYAMVSSRKFLIYFDQDSIQIHVNFFAPILLSLKWEERNSTIDLRVEQKIGKRVAGTSRSSQPSA
uniref:Uncharacterized protein n=1 Tax=Salix viminalis TaxID=40686 RepID=A0A6N2ML01_SALVM